MTSGQVVIYGEYATIHSKAVNISITARFDAGTDFCRLCTGTGHTLEKAIEAMHLESARTLANIIEKTPLEEAQPEAIHD